MDDVVRRLQGEVEHALADIPRLVLAISGGIDSMVLLDAAIATGRDRIASIATFDHRSGMASSRAAAVVERRGRSLGVPVHRGMLSCSGLARPTEARWREARWRFLRDIARREEAVVATAHTRDDQLETILLRVLRGAGARGLAGLAAASPGIVRPLLAIDRELVTRYAAVRALEWVDDPTNRSRQFLRNRVRLDLLPALRRANPAFDEELLALGERAAELRASIESYVSEHVVTREEGGELAVARSSLLSYDASEVALLWPAIAARVGVVLDRRGTRRLSAFTKDGREGGRIQLSGDVEVVLHRGDFRLRRVSTGSGHDEERALRDGLVIGSCRFRVPGSGGTKDLWHAELPAGASITARPWQSGDRMTPSGASAPRRVKGLLRDAGVDPVSRRRWPVVLVEGEIVWVPGVRRAEAATVRSGRPVIRVACERILGR